MKAVSVATMRALEAAAIRSGIPGRVLMERAGRGAAAEIIEFCRRLPPVHCRRWAVLAGKGNNGGDAYVVARCLAEQTSLPVTVYAVVPREDLGGDAGEQAAHLPEEVPVVVGERLPPDALTPGTVLIDGLLGTGINGPARPPFREIIEQVNAAGLPVLALDVPSGLDADSGCGAPAIEADLTVTLGLVKQGLLTPPGLARCGVLRLVDIGLAAADVAAAPAAGEAVLADDIRPLLGRRPQDAHKHRFGHLLVAGGCLAYAGAPLLAGAAALRAGAGLVTVGVPERLRPLLTPPLLSLIVRAIPDDGRGAFGAASAPALASLAAGVQGLLYGPGTGAAPEAGDALAALLAAPGSAILDADGLRALAARPALLPRASPTVLTPHPGEMRALLEGFGLAALAEATRPAQAQALARRTGAVVVLKGRGTVLADPGGSVAVNTSGTSALASAGTGDVLAGLMGGLLVQGLTAWDAARAAVFLHGLAAELAPHGMRALTADDLLDMIPAALRQVSPFA